MGSKRWRLADTRKQKWQLDTVKRFLSSPGSLSACSVAISIVMDKREAAVATGGLVSAVP